MRLTALSSLTGRKEGVGPCTMIGRVDNPGDLRETRSKQSLNTLPDRDLRKAASLAPALEADMHAAFGDIDQGHSSAVGRDGGIHLGVEDPAYALDQIGGAVRRRRGPRAPDSHSRAPGHPPTPKRLALLGRRADRASA